MAGPGCRRVLDQLQGASAAVAAWEPDLLAARVSDYDPRWLDELCLAGELTWLRLVPPPGEDPDQRGAGPSKATPVSLVYRDDLPWLLAAVRGEASPPVPAAGAVAEIVEAIAEHGACFAGELVDLTRRLPTEIEEALWEAVARGLLTSDGFAAIRAAVPGRTSGPAPTGARSAGSGGVGAWPAGAPGAGRWSAAPRLWTVVTAPTGSTATTWPRPSPTSCSPGGVWCSTTSRPTRARPCAGGSSSGRCVAWRTAARSAAGGS